MGRSRSSTAAVRRKCSRRGRAAPRFSGVRGHTARCPQRQEFIPVYVTENMVGTSSVSSRSRRTFKAPWLSEKTPLRRRASPSMRTVATARFVRGVRPQSTARLDQIRGRSVGEALATLRYTPRSAARLSERCCAPRSRTPSTITRCGISRSAGRACDCRRRPSMKRVQPARWAVRSSSSTAKPSEHSA